MLALRYIASTQTYKALVFPRLNISPKYQLFGFLFKLAFSQALVSPCRLLGFILILYFQSYIFFYIL